MNKTAVAIVGILSGLLIIGGFLGVLSAQLGWAEQEEAVTQPAPAPVEEETIEPVEDFIEVERLIDISIEEIYSQVGPGMSEEQVWEIAGRPDITSQADIEGLGSATNMIYSDGHSLDNVTISLQNGIVEQVTIGDFDGDKIDVRSKM
jgi:hypothetical protein